MVSFDNSPLFNINPLRIFTVAEFSCVYCEERNSISKLDEAHITSNQKPAVLTTPTRLSSDVVHPPAGKEIKSD